jgi:hypothetical protein
LVFKCIQLKIKQINRMTFMPTEIWSHMLFFGTDNSNLVTTCKSIYLLKQLIACRACGKCGNPSLERCRCSCKRTSATERCLRGIALKLCSAGVDRHVKSHLENAIKNCWIYKQPYLVRDSARLARLMRSYSRPIRRAAKRRKLNEPS